MVWKSAAKWLLVDPACSPMGITCRSGLKASIMKMMRAGMKSRDDLDPCHPRAPKNLPMIVKSWQGEPSAIRISVPFGRRLIQVLSKRPCARIRWRTSNKMMG